MFLCCSKSYGMTAEKLLFAIQAVQQFRVGQEHGFLIYFACHRIVDICKFISTCKFISPDFKYPVRPDGLDGNYLLYTSWNYKSKHHIRGQLPVHKSNSLFPCSCMGEAKNKAQRQSRRLILKR